jgi:hypothetical protein
MPATLIKLGDSYTIPLMSIHPSSSIRAVFRFLLLGMQAFLMPYLVASSSIQYLRSLLATEQAASASPR